MPLILGKENEIISKKLTTIGLNLDIFSSKATKVIAVPLRNMKLTKAFVTVADVATITCPNCNKSKNIAAGKYLKRCHTIKVRCSCNNKFAVLLDFRRHYRKETNLEGTYVMVPPAVGKGRLNILNISRSGVGFTIGFSVQGSHNIIPDQKMKIHFHLDDKKGTAVEKTVTIRNVDEHYIGAEFEVSGAFEKDLGFYLQP